MSTLIQPTPVTLGGKTYHVGKFPATVGREVLTQYPATGIPKVGDYAANDALMLKVLSYVEVETDAGLLRLNSRALVDNHVVGDDTIGAAEVLVKLEWAAMQHNFSFFRNGKAQDFLGALGAQVQQSITKTLMGFLPQSSPKS